jgi:cellulose synthase/poly-beta-1,6-N-acetylglucosamine synthase-like glycosyltransferase
MTAFQLWQLIFWLSILGVAYIFLGYPLIVFALSRLRPLRTTKRPSSQPISVVIVAYNEAARLPKKIASVFASDDAPLIEEVIVASDGSTDDTAAVIAALNYPRVKVLAFEERRGKPSVLNDVVPNCLAEIVVLTDARQELDRRAIAELAANFADSRVGAVSGELVFRSEGDTTTASQGVGVYWSYEKFIRKCEGRLRSVPGATGALYAMRRSLFQAIPAQTILDDVVIPMQVVSAGYRCLFEPAAMAFDQPSDSTAKEAIRKRRTVAGAAQLMVNHPAWLWPRRNPIWFEFVSHKLLRLVSPLLLFTAAVANVQLAGDPAYAALLTWQVAFYLSALAGWGFQRAGRRSALFGAQLMFVTLNAITVTALWDALRGRFQATWQRV